MGENQKKTTESYRKNWDRIFGVENSLEPINQEVEEEDNE